MAPPHLRRPHPRRARGRSSTPTPAAGRPQRAGAARRPQGGPDGAVDARPRAGCTYASELVELARERRRLQHRRRRLPRGPPVGRRRSTHDADVLVAKAQAGAEFAVTQMFFRAADYFGLVERVRAPRRRHPDPAGHHADHEPRPAAAGWPSSPGADGPRRGASPASRRHDGDPADVRARGHRASPTELCEELLAGGAPGLHFYTLNRSTATLEIFAALRITR